MVVGGAAAGFGPQMELLDRVGEVSGDTPVICGTGCKMDNIEDVLKRCNGAFVGSSLKKDGKFENPVDVFRVRKFMDRVRELRGEA